MRVTSYRSSHMEDVEYFIIMGNKTQEWFIELTTRFQTLWWIQAHDLLYYLKQLYFISEWLGANHFSLAVWEFVRSTFCSLKAEQVSGTGLIPKLPSIIGHEAVCESNPQKTCFRTFPLCVLQKHNVSVLSLAEAFVEYSFRISSRGGQYNVISTSPGY